MIAHKKGHNPLLEGGEPSPPSHIKAVFATNEDREFYGPMAGAPQGFKRWVCVYRVDAGRISGCMVAACNTRALFDCGTLSPRDVHAEVQSIH